MANVVLYFSILNESESAVYEMPQVLDKLPKPDSIDVTKTSNVKDISNTNLKIKKDYSFDYKYSFKDISNMQQCNMAILAAWHSYEATLFQLVKNGHFKIFVRYEITSANNEYPLLQFDGEFTQFLGKLNATFILELVNE